MATQTFISNEEMLKLETQGKVRTMEFISDEEMLALEQQTQQPSVIPRFIPPGVRDIGKVIPAIQKGVELAERGIRATRVPRQIGRGVGLLGGLVGGITGATLGVGEAIAKKQPIFETTKRQAIESAKATAEFGRFIGEEGGVVAPFAGLGKIPSAVIAAPILYQGVKEKDLTKFTIGSLAVIGAKFSKGRWIDPALKYTPSQSKLARQATDAYRTVLKPNAAELRNIELRQGKDINSFYRLAAEEKLPIARTADNKLDTTRAREIIQEKLRATDDLTKQQIRTQPQKQFDLEKIRNKTKNELRSRIKNDTEFNDAASDVDRYIDDAMAARGRYLSGEQLTDFKSGMWSVGYNFLRPTAQSTARKVGHITKEMIENAYPDMNIKAINELTGRYATLNHLLESASTKVVSSGVLQKATGRVLGAIAGSQIPIVGPLAGQYLGGKTAQFLASPTRLSTKAAAKAERAGIAGKSFKETTEQSRQALQTRFGRPSPYLALPPARTIFGQAQTETARQAEIARTRIQVSPAERSFGRDPSTGRFKRIFKGTPRR